MSNTVFHVSDGDDEQSITDFIETSVDFRVSDQVLDREEPTSPEPNNPLSHDEEHRSSSILSLWHNWPPVLDRTGVEQVYTVASNGFVVSTLKKAVLMQHAADVDFLDLSSCGAIQLFPFART